MRWAVNLYTTEKTKKMLPRIMHKVRTGRVQSGVWLITIASNEQNLLDIFHAINLPHLFGLLMPTFECQLNFHRPRAL